MNAANSYPEFKHDCHSCYFIEHRDGCDLWFCPLHGGQCIKRFGDDEPEYSCLPLDVIDYAKNEAYHIILERARELGLTLLV